MKNNKALVKTLKQGVCLYIGMLIWLLIRHYFFEADVPWLFSFIVGPFIYFVLMIPIYLKNKKNLN